MGNILYTEKLVVGYPGLEVLREANISLEPGEILCLIGPNGVGKSTLLRTIAGHLPALGGDIYIEDRPLDSFSHQERAMMIASVMTGRLRSDYMSCRDVVSAGRYPYTGRLGILSREDREKVDEAIDAVHARDVADKDFSKISDGQRQRIVLARALCQDTPILILDEPVSYLDLHYKADILATIRSMTREKGLAVLMSLHELELAGAVSDRIICVDKGRLRARGAPGDVLTAGNIESLFSMPEGSCKQLAQAIRDSSRAIRGMTDQEDRN